MIVLSIRRQTNTSKHGELVTQVYLPRMNIVRMIHTSFQLVQNYLEILLIFIRLHVDLRSHLFIMRFAWKMDPTM